MALDGTSRDSAATADISYPDRIPVVLSTRTAMGERAVATSSATFTYSALHPASLRPTMRSHAMRPESGAMNSNGDEPVDAPRILVVEDDETLLMAVVGVLSREGFLVG